MNKLTILISFLAGVAASASHESLRGNQLDTDIFTNRHLFHGCYYDSECSGNGKCHGEDVLNSVTGYCKCKDGWVGEHCDIEQCGSVVSCGKHGKCRHDECECDEGYTGDECEDEIEYKVKLIVAKIDSKTRGNSGCEDDLDDLLDDLEDEDNDDKLDLDTVTVIDVPTECGDGESLDERSIIHRRRRRRRRRNLKDDDEEAIVIGVVLVDSNSRSVSDDDCLENLKHAAHEISDHMKPKHLEDLDGTVVYIEADDDCDEDSAKRILEDDDKDE